MNKLLDANKDSSINVVTTRIYGMQTIIDYNKIKNNMNKLFNEIKN